MADDDLTQVPQPGQAEVEESQVTPVVEGAGQGLTEARVRDIVTEAVKGVLVDVERTQQSQRDKLEARVRKEVESRIAALAEAGVEPTEQQKRTIESATRKQIASAEATKPVEPEGDGDDPVTLAANAMMRQAGVEITPEDPEAQPMIAARTPQQFIAATQKAIEAKKARLAKSQAQPETEAEAPTNTTPVPSTPQVNPAGRVVQTGGTAGGGGSRESLTRELAALIAKPSPANLERIRELQAKLRTYN
ncbi:MAG TPA: hypothetical protein PLA25_07340 [Anaerolineaceae bacterium]|nr:hypothetical protein [Anaerolineaceae bacterium]